MSKKYNDYNKKKFRIKEILDNLPYNKRLEIKKQLPGILGLSKRTIDRILNAETGSNQTFSAEGLIKIAALLDSDPENLFNHVDEILLSNQLADKIGLTA